MNLTKQWLLFDGGETEEKRVVLDAFPIDYPNLNQMIKPLYEVIEISHYNSLKLFIEDFDLHEAHSAWKEYIKDIPMKRSERADFVAGAMWLYEKIKKNNFNACMPIGSGESGVK